MESPIGERIAHSMWSVREAAAELGVSERAIRHAIASGELLAEKRGGVFQINPAALARYRTLRPGIRLLPLPPSESSAGALPRPRTSLVGRERALPDARQRLLHAEARLLTFTGPGGVGKTRLAIELASSVRDEYPDGVVFVPLAPVRDPSLVALTIARACGLPDTGGPQVVSRLQKFLRPKTLLLVLDNVEHVLDATPNVAELLDACPRLTVLATSRALLRLSGEQVYRVTPLEAPEAPGDASLDDSALASAVQLFALRAKAVSPDFELTPSNAHDVAAACRRLDGLPLAIELAAARSNLLSPRDLLARLELSLPVLIDGPRDEPARHQTMRDAVAWSCDLLTPEQSQVFRRLAVFAGGWTIDAIEYVAHGDDEPEGEIIDRLAALVNHSLVLRMTRPGDESRFGMLETIRAYAWELLKASGELGVARERHAAFFFALAEQGSPDFLTAAGSSWIARLDADYLNLRTALTWADEQDAPEMLLRFAAALWWFWRTGGHVTEGHHWMERAIARLSSGHGDPPMRAEVLIGAGDLAQLCGDAPRALRLLEAGLSQARAAGSETLVARGLFFLAATAELRAELDVAEALLTEALDLWRKTGEKAWIAGTLFSLGGLARWRRDLDAAAAFHAEALSLSEQIDFQYGMIWAHLGLGRTALSAENLRMAAASLGQALDLAIKKDDLALIALCLEGFGRAAWMAGRPEDAARLLGSADAATDKVGIVTWPNDQAERDEIRGAIRSALGQDAFANATASGRRLTLPEAVSATREIGTNAPESGASAPVPHLTPRERDVLQRLAQGLTDREIGEAIFMSERTVEWHLSNIFGKLGVKSRSAAAAYAVRFGLA